MCQKESLHEVVVQIESDRLTWEKLQQGKTKDGDCGSSTDKPKWFREDLYLRGQELLMDNLLCAMFCHLAGLILGVAIEIPYTVLANTGNHGSLKDLASRYLSTSDKIMKWYSTDIFDPSTEGAKSIAMVRKMHATSHRAMNRSHPTPETNELWMSQFYMATTQISFVGLMMICPAAVGLGHLSKADKEAIIHYWRCIGYLLGISDEYNVCGGSLDDLRSLTTAFVDKLLRPSMLEISSDKFNMARGILDSILKSIGNKLVTRNGFIAYWCPILQVDFNEKLTLRDRICIWGMKLMYSSGITNLRIIRRFLNYRHEQRYLKAYAKPNTLPDSLLNDFYGEYPMCPYLVKKTS